MRICNKILIITLIILLFNMSVLLPKSNAISKIIKDAKNFTSKANNVDNLIDKNNLKEVSSDAYNILLGCGIAVAVLVGAFLGIKFIMESAEGKAKVAEVLVPYIIGCAVVFGAFLIWKIVIDIGNGMGL